MPFYLIAMITALFGLAFFLIKRKRRSIDWVLVLFNFILFLPIFLGFFVIRGPGPQNQYVQFISYFPLLYGPLLFIYVDVVLLKKIRFRKSYLVHFIPFIVIVLASYILTAFNITIGRPLFVPLNPEFNAPPPPEKIHNFHTLIKSIPHSIRHAFYSPMTVILSLATFASLVFYTVLVIKRVIRNKVVLNNFFSFKSNILHVNYVIWLMGIFVVITSLNILSQYTRGMYPMEIDIFITESIEAGKGLFIILLNFFSIKLEKEFEKFRFFREPSGDAIPAVDTGEADNEKYKKTALDDDTMNRILSKVSACMEEQRNYRNGEFTLERLAEDTGIRRNYISQTINHKLQKNFFQYVNELRLDHFIREIKKPENNSDDILSLAITAGFNSKSTFYSFFKKEMNMTPVQYRKQLTKS